MARPLSSLIEFGGFATATRKNRRAPISAPRRRMIVVVVVSACVAAAAASRRNDSETEVALLRPYCRFFRIRQFQKFYHNRRRFHRHPRNNNNKLVVFPNDNDDDDINMLSSRLIDKYSRCQLLAWLSLLSLALLSSMIRFPSINIQIR